MKNLSHSVLQHDAHWAIYAPAGQALLQQLRAIDAGVHVAEFQAREIEIEMARGSSDTVDKPYEMEGGVAMIYISGPMTKSPTSMEGGCSTVRARRLVRSASNDPDVLAVCLCIDSPGGSVSGTSELAEDVAALSAKKPTAAYVDAGYCCSAAYWVASQAGSLYGGPTSIVGSIGTYMVAYDLSRLYENAGVEALLFATGQYKGAGSTGVAITPEQRESFQGTVDDLQEHFAGAVAKGRRMKRENVNELADGGVHVGQKAVAKGLMDGVASLDEVVAMLRGAVSQKARAKAMRAETTNDFAPSGKPLIGVPLEQALDSALTAVEWARGEVTAVTQRLASVKALREQQGRPFSQERLETTRDLRGGVSGLLESVSALVLECECLGTTSPAITAANEQEDPEVDAGLEEALASAAETLSLNHTGA